MKITCHVSTVDTSPTHCEPEFMPPHSIEILFDVTGVAVIEALKEDEQKVNRHAMARQVIGVKISTKFILRQGKFFKSKGK